MRQVRRPSACSRHHMQHVQPMIRVHRSQDSSIVSYAISSQRFDLNGDGSKLSLQDLIILSISLGVSVKLEKSPFFDHSHSE